MHSQRTAEMRMHRQHTAAGTSNRAEFKLKVTCTRSYVIGRLRPSENGIRSGKQ